ncbi:MAG: hypothetical protein ATN31_05560 [Candidatus Epulonipiscioides saccharophilum]|nr:MAG: hypothetical protein ATN31_05560 [Epulopiscium sp. AS2M-Bin001]
MKIVKKKLGLLTLLTIFITSLSGCTTLDAVKAPIIKYAKYKATQIDLEELPNGSFTFDYNGQGYIITDEIVPIEDTREALAHVNTISLDDDNNDNDQFYPEFNTINRLTGDETNIAINIKLNYLWDYYKCVPLSEQETYATNIFNLHNYKNLVQNSIDRVQHSKDLAQNSIDQVQHSKDLVQHSKDLIQHSKDLAQHSKDLAQHSKDLAQNSIDN